MKWSRERAGSRASLSAVAAFVAVAAMGAFCAAGAAQAAGGIKAINVSPQIASDNERYIAFQRPDGVPVAHDTMAGKTRELTGARYCQPRAVGGGKVLLICPREKRTDNDTGFRARTGSVLGGPTRALGASDVLTDAYEIGRRWVFVDLEIQRPGTPADHFVNIRNGNLRRVWPVRMHHGRDLDSAKLKPLEVKSFDPRFKTPNDSEKNHATICRGRDVVVTDQKKELRLWWSKDRSVRLGRGGLLPYECEWYQSVRVGSRQVTWNRGPVVSSYDYSTGQRYKRRFSKGVRVTPYLLGIVVAERVRKVSRHDTRYRIRIIPLRGPDSQR